jgi:hypothetical protein
MLESITYLIETVKLECNPVKGNAQIDRLYDLFDHYEGDWEMSCMQSAAFSATSIPGFPGCVWLRHMPSPCRLNAHKHAFPAANKLVS